MEPGLRVQEGGRGEPLLVLLHGLGATGDVWAGWRPALARRWRLAADPGAYAVGAPDMAQLLARSPAPVILARGEHDPMSTDEQLARLGAPAVTLAGLGHNAHVEDPEASIALLDPVSRPA